MQDWVPGQKTIAYHGIKFVMKNLKAFYIGGQLEICEIFQRGGYFVIQALYTTHK